MRKTILVVAALCLILGGCAHQQFGDFVEVKEPAIYKAIANDVADHLSDKYMVGENSFQVDPEMLGPLGLEIDAVLRERGYAISAASGIPLNYVFDQVEAGSGHIYRLSLNIGDSLHSKAYRAGGDTLVGSNPWTVRYERDGQVLAEGGAQ